jgi:RNA polymerase sigma-32 factor
MAVRSGKPEEDSGGAGPSTPAEKNEDEKPQLPKPKPGRVPRRRATAKPAEPEVVEERDEEDEEEDEGSGASAASGAVIDVGTMPTLPSRPVSTGVSVPALRGVARVDALQKFLTEMGKYPLLSKEEERELTLRYFENQDPAAARKLVVHNLRLVVKMAYKYRRAWASVLDLIQEGNVGLVEAVRRYDPFKGAKFSTYATFWIRAYMLRYLLEHSRMVRISRTRVGRKLFFQLSREREKLRALGVDPGPKLLAERLGVDQEELEEVVRHMDQAEVRLDAPLSNEEGSGGTLLDGFSSSVATPEAEAYRKEFAEDVSRALESFAETLTDEREKDAWQHHLMAEEPVSLSQLGEKYGVTKQRMGQIVAALRKRLKAHLIATLGPDVELGFTLEGD